MVADEVDYVVGVDTHRDQHVLAVVVAPAGAVVGQRTVAANGRGYAQAVRFAQQYANGARAWAVEGAGHYGAGLARYLNRRGEAVLEVGRSPRSERRLRGKDDELDAVRAARAALAVSRWRCHVRDGAAKRCGCCWSPDAAPSTSAAKRWCSCAA